MTDLVVAAPPSPEPTPPSEPIVIVTCANCGEELHGEYCSNCGQPLKGMIRPLSSMLHDIADTIFNIDSRIFRTLWPLFVKPGYLSNEYFAGRRVRFVTPFRLYFFMSIAAFFAMQIWLGDMNFNVDDEGVLAKAGLSNALTKEEVIARRDALQLKLDAEKTKHENSAKVLARLQIKQDRLKDDADKRIAYLAKVADAKAKNLPPPPETDGEIEDDSDNQIMIFGKPWDREKHPISVGWLPAFANTKLNDAVAHAQSNINRFGSDPKPLIIAGFGMLPQVLFVVMPLFALILKIFFIFKRRLYMEHLIIALHSHAFIFFTLLLIVLLTALKSSLETTAAWLNTPLDWLIFALMAWIPIYLFVMQKRVYKQGWIMTTIKYCIIGISYVFIIAFGAAFAFVIGVATA